MNIDCVVLIFRHCGVQHSTPHASRFREPCIRTFFLKYR